PACADGTGLRLLSKFLRIDLRGSGTIRTRSICRDRGTTPEFWVLCLPLLSNHPAERLSRMQLAPRRHRIRDPEHCQQCEPEEKFPGQIRPDLSFLNPGPLYH